MRQLWIFLALASCGALLPADGARATTRATLNLYWNEARFDVLDTDPDDGLTPVFERKPMSIGLSVSADAGTASIDGNTRRLRADDLATASLSATSTTATSSSSATVENSVITFSSTAATGAALPPGLAHTADVHALMQSGITLSAPGVMLLTLPWDLTLDGEAGESENNSQVFLEMYAQRFPSPASHQPDYLAHSARLFASHRDGAFDGSGTLSLPFYVARGGESTRFSFEVFVSSFGTPDTVVAQPIPEPETWAMMLAGLGVLGARLNMRQAGRRNHPTPGPASGAAAARRHRKRAG